MSRRNLPNRKSIRLKGWDYRKPGLYFITLCTENREHHFGEIRDGIMGLSVPGCIAWHFWRKIPDHQSNVILDEFIAMPDHIHAIIGIEAEIESEGKSVGTRHDVSVTKSIKSGEQAKFGAPQSKSISMIINHYKGAITRWCNANGHDHFAWQARFYDHIIRNDRALQRIRKYIQNNPLQWQLDMNGGEVHERGVKYMTGSDLLP